MSEFNLNFRGNLLPYEYDMGEGTVTSPFPVLVVGLEDEDLGIGRLSGGFIDEDGLPVSVVELDDPSAPDGVVVLIGDQCYWEYLGNDVEAQEIIDDYVENPDRIRSANDYLIGLYDESLPYVYSPLGYCALHKS